MNNLFYLIYTNILIKIFKLNEIYQINQYYFGKNL